ncbi:Helicase PriA essential for oriC/DnaA-independent DNA replication [[Actinomadura] parvosata subsp. kistnae]|uniref:primosomal protein N' n=1 Tax=[Actinomadura] parvosata TaxID=1955412 RepID=UPI000D283DE1|nr:Helicase PriA essential for oriC/DnaA-independent DNA replication [Actinomadura parvosata subsp. kistnae]
MTRSSDDALLPLEAVRPAQSSKDTKGAPVPAPENPVARVVVDSPLPHLDRPFDYLIPEAMHETAEPGVRVRVRFAGKLVDGFLLERVSESEHEGKLTPLERVVSPERVLTPEIAGLARAVADRYAGTLTDVLRLAVPPRHAKAEAEAPKPDAPKSASPETGPSADPQGPDAAPVHPSSPSAATAGPEAVPVRPPFQRTPAASPDAAPGRPADASPAAGPGRPADASPDTGERPVSAWDAYPAGPSFLSALRDGRAPRAVWSALPGARGWAGAVAEAVRATLDGGRGAVVVVPDGKDVALADAEFGRLLGPGRHVALTADLGPAERYRRWLKVLRGQVRAVVGTRAAMFAPVADLGLVVIWDDGDDLHAERLAPYPHAREVLGLRAHRTGAGMLIGGYARTAEATQLVASGWARPIVAARTTIRSLAPRVRPAGEDAELAKDQAARQARLPSIAWRALRAGLESGPVLVQVPRRGYLPALACQHCRTPARCVLPPTRTAHGDLPQAEVQYAPGARAQLPAGGVQAPFPAGAQTQLPAGAQTQFPAGAQTELAAGVHGRYPAGVQTMPGGQGPLCHGPLALRGGHAAPYCRWCGRVDAGWRCPSCGSPRLRAVVTGARRTAEELGRAFPSVPVKTSGRDGVLASVPAARALVVATPGAEPVAEGGYAAAVLLDGWALLGRADLRAGEETVRRWMNAAALLRPAAELVVLGDAALPAVQALLRWDPVTHAERELADRAELGFPPAVRMATLTGAAAAVRQMLDEVRLPPDAQVLGPVPVDESGQERAMIRVRRAGGAALAAALKGASGVRAARKTPDVVRVSVDPLDLI